MQRIYHARRHDLAVMALGNEDEVVALRNGSQVCRAFEVFLPQIHVASIEPRTYKHALIHIQLTNLKMK